MCRIRRSNKFYNYYYLSLFAAFIIVIQLFGTSPHGLALLQGRLIQLSVTLLLFLTAVGASFNPQIIIVVVWSLLLFSTRLEVAVVLVA